MRACVCACVRVCVRVCVSHTLYSNNVFRRAPPFPLLAPFNPLSSILPNSCVWSILSSAFFAFCRVRPQLAVLREAPFCSPGSPPPAGSSSFFPERAIDFSLLIYPQTEKYTFLLFSPFFFAPQSGREPKTKLPLF